MSTKIKVILLSIAAWFVFWLPFMAISIIDIPFLDSIFGLDLLFQTELLIGHTLVLIVSALLAWLTFHKLIHDYRFLKVRKWLFLLYLLPLAAMINLYINNPSEIFGVNTLLYLLFMTLSVLYQDVLTFGFLQTILEKKTGQLVAAILTALVFYIGHLNFGIDAFSLIHVAGFIIFSFSRYLTGTIYVANVIHLTFILLA